jgi:hypothetical protein
MTTIFSDVVKNEAAILAACLARLHWVDEIVVLDGGSNETSVVHCFSDLPMASVVFCACMFFVPAFCMVSGDYY